MSDKQGEVFYTDAEGKQQDAEIHDQIISEAGDVSALDPARIERLLRLGIDLASIHRLYGSPAAPPQQPQQQYDPQHVKNIIQQYNNSGPPNRHTGDFKYKGGLTGD